MFCCWRRAVLRRCKLRIYELASCTVHEEVSVGDGYFFYFFFGALCSVGCQQKRRDGGHTNKKALTALDVPRPTTGGKMSLSDGEKTEPNAKPAEPDDGVRRLILCI